ERERAQLLVPRRQRQLEPRAERAALDSEAQRDRDVLEVLGQRQRVDVDAELGLARVLERLGLARKLDRGAAHLRGKVRLHVDVELAWEAGDERYPDLKIAHHVDG